MSDELDFLLQPDESIVWEARTISGLRVAAGRKAQGLIGLFFFGFSMIWCPLVVVGGNNNWDKGKDVPPFAPHNVAIATAMGLVMIPAGLTMLTSPLRAWLRAGDVRYMITDRRAIIHEAGGRGRSAVESFMPEDLGEMRVVERGDGSGDLVFLRKPTVVLGLPVNGITDAVGFLGVEEVRRVEALIRTTLLKKGQEPVPGGTGQAPLIG